MAMTRNMMILQLLLLMSLVVTIVGHKWHWWGFGVLSAGLAAQVAAITLLGLTSLGLLLWMAWRKWSHHLHLTAAAKRGRSGRHRRSRSRRSRGWLAPNPARVPQLIAICLLALLPMLVVLITMSSELEKPIIHDITTDTETVPEFQAALMERTVKENSLEYEGERIARLQRNHYPDLVPLVTSQPPEAAYVAAEMLVAQRGWRVLRSDLRRGELEATAESGFLGLRHDVIIRVRPEAVGSRVDMRSVSRVGNGDLGMNAAQIEAFMADLAAALEPQLVVQ